jgi:predicted ribosomally synthesized peptide with nif11-like leader
MSLKNVKAFYERLARDESFRDRLQNVSSREESDRIVRKAGYKFTQAEFEEYTAQLLESTASDDDELREVSEKELEAVLGGAGSILDKTIITPIYGGPHFPFPRPHPPIKPMYGVIDPPE